MTVEGQVFAVAITPSTCLVICLDIAQLSQEHLGIGKPSARGKLAPEVNLVLLRRGKVSVDLFTLPYRPAVIEFGICATLLAILHAFSYNKNAHVLEIRQAF
jgi:hypothetical protein